MADESHGLIVHVPPGFEAAKYYAIDVVFKWILQLDYQVRPSTEAAYRIEIGQQQIVLADVLLSGTCAKLLASNLTPSQSLSVLQLPPAWCHDMTCPATLPVLFGEPNIRMQDNQIECDSDFFGSVFFMLSRYEEVVSAVRDAHERFPASASLAAKEQFLDRPIVSDYACALLSMIRSLKPSIKPSNHAGEVRITCDVDHPFDPLRSQPGLVTRTAAADILKRRSIVSALRRVGGFFEHRIGRHDADTNYSFDWYTRACAEAGKSATFYFIPDRTAGSIDGYYDVFDRRIIKLIRRLASQGHTIGAHGSYNSFRNPVQVSHERQRLLTACRKAGIEVQIEGNRQHYLRWDARETADHLDAADYRYDSSGGYADAPGFRYGTAHAFPMWSWQKKGALDLLQRPLILMDTTLLSAEYLGLESPQQMLDLSTKLATRSLVSGGDFTILWHNSNLKTAAARHLFQSIIS